MNNKVEAIFFCSSFNDVSYILSEFEFKKYNNVLIFVVNNLGAYRFIESLNIKGVKLEFLQSYLKNVKNPFHWLKEFFYLHFYLFLKFKNIENLPIYFYATFYDYISMYASVRLNNKNTLYLGYVPNDNEFISHKRWFKDILFSILYISPLCSYRSFGINVIGLTTKYVGYNFNIGREINKNELIEIQNKFCYPSVKQNFYVLFLISIEDDGVKDVHLSSKEIYLSIINQFTADNILLKSHPRLGPPTFFSSFKFIEIPSYVPIEFVDLVNCKLVVGLNSISLSNIASRGIKAVSLLELVEFFSEEIRSQYKEYLTINTFGYEIKFPKSLDELFILLK